MRRLLLALCMIVHILAQAQDRDVHDFDSAGIWTVGSEWEVFFEPEYEDGVVLEKSVRYRLGHADDGYMTLHKTEYMNGMGGDTLLIGYIRNESDTMIYVRPILDDGSIGKECLLYDFSTPFEYGETIRYGLQDGNIGEEYIDWQKGSLQYYVINGDTQLLPSWGGIIYRYGYIGGPMELFQCNQVPNNKKRPKATNISHVIFSTKGKHKVPRGDNSPETDFEVCIPYRQILTNVIKWECMDVSKSGLNETYMVEIKGDTIIGNRICKQVCSTVFSAKKVIFEEGRKIYMVNADNEPEVLLNFGLDQEEKICNFLWEHCILLPEEDEDSISCVLRCWEGNVLVYQSPLYELSTGINRTSTENESLIYDLQGRRLRSIPERGIYIIGNKKVIIK